MSSKFGQIRLLTMELAALELQKKNPHRFIIGEKRRCHFSLLFLIESFSYLPVMMTYIRAWMSSKFGQIRPRTTELAGLERLKIDVASFLG